MWEKRYFLRINNLYQIDVQTSSGGGTSASRICTRRTFLAMYQLSNFGSQRILLFVKEKFVKEEKGKVFLRRQIRIVSYYVKKPVKNENIKTGVSRKIFVLAF